MHPADKEYAHYSAIHKQYSRIDYIFIQQNQLTSIQKVEIESAAWSDHGPVTLRMDSPRVRPTSWTWRLQDSLLLDLSVRERVSEDLTCIETTDDQTVTTIWEAHKSVLRGTLMHLASKKKNESQRQMRELMVCINALETQHKLSQLEETYKELLEARRSLLMHITAPYYNSLQHPKAFFYQHVNKGGKLLARMLRGPQGMTQVHKLRTTDGMVTQFPDRIALEIHSFYSSLYSIPQPTLPEERADTR
ncbi:UDP-Gal:beta c beta 1,4- galactosyltransferase, polypeptide 1, gene 1 isoform X1 [Pelobates cultripes]|uniref:UDP-Gal:beta c beta 1,4- galactosyltransferase, polypeptide 1, gene 1 isoform X1 n=1 Tax=Pelobates cultripes TaxID=61616 RepID=A0AAD1RT09_PELCU|nr:UDP-Gal:beta c beta 1,4- galactosyltransferase, polypeptide 1, gene 1 isoform X1 [Pelobates cultripes]